LIEIKALARNMGFIDHLIDHPAQMTTFEYRRPFGWSLCTPLE
jgi:hypothetical protein